MAMADMKWKWTFGYGDEDAVECPQLDAFRNDLIALCRKHGVSIEHERGWGDGDSGHIKLIPYREGDALDDVFYHLEDAGEGISWLDSARDQFHANQQRRYDARRKAEADQKAALEKRQVDEALAKGVVLQGKKYRLVPDE
jgi:hypothetical protein